MLFRVGVVMLSVAKLTLGQEAYYEQQVVGGVDDYYAGRGESPGLWVGSGASVLGLAGVVEDGGLGTLLRGVDPAGDAVLRAPVRERTITVRRLDVESGEWHEEAKRLAPVSGYDLVFSCPKSVSLLHALTDDDAVRREVSEAHESAWQAALGYLEHEACVVRRGHGGAVREHGDGFVAAAFRHRTSRAQDPHLHTHVIVANMARSTDGEWRALDGEAILRTYRLAAGYLYEAQLRHELTRRLGLEWTEPAKGMADLVGVPEEAVRAFSTRRQSLLEHMEALGTDGFAAARVAALATREAKEQIDLPRLREQWLARAAENGLGRSQLERLVRQRPLTSAPVVPEQLASAVLELTAKQTAFSMPELVRAVAGSMCEGAPVVQVIEVAAELSRLPGLELVEAGEVPGRPARFTTRELVDLERGALELALAGQNVGAPSANGRTLLRTLVSSGLAGEQQELVRRAALSRDRVVCVVGVAGAGKTRALAVLGETLRASGVPVVGAAPSGRAADELQTATAIPSGTLHRLLLDVGRGGGLPRGCVLVVDEAGMAGTRTLAPLLERVAAAEGKAVLVGDPEQLPSVDAGGLYPALCERLDTLALGHNRRQREPSERQALAHLRSGDPEPYLTHAARHGRLHVYDEATATKQRLLADWWHAAADDAPGSVMIAYRRDDIQELNDAAHALMLRTGGLGDNAHVIRGREFRVGDRVLCRHNDRELGIRNGTRATIAALDPAGLTLETDAGASRPIPLDYAFTHLDHGYAMTGHAAQGATVERAFVLAGDQGALHEWGYVACSRARTQTHLYLTDASLDPETPQHEPDRNHAPGRLARAMRASAREPLAADQLDAGRHAPSRLIEAARREFEQQQARAQERLADAEQKLGKLGWRGRGRRGEELRTEIAWQQTALHLVERKLRDPALMSRSRPHPKLTDTALSRDRARHRHERTPERTRGLERAHGLEIEL
jgi:conjugative relaxase-like TrwC/TraI family protein